MRPSLSACASALSLSLAMAALAAACGSPPCTVGTPGCTACAELTTCGECASNVACGWCGASCTAAAPGDRGTRPTACHATWTWQPGTCPAVGPPPPPPPAWADAGAVTR